LRALAPTPRSLLPRRRFYSIERSPAASKAPADIQPTEEELTEEQLAENETQDIEKDSGTPWFLEVEAPRHPASQHAVTLPKAPENAPELLEPLIKYVYEDMGLDELALLDLRELDPPAALGPNLIMLLATARSERHLHVSASRFVKWLRKNYKVSAKAGGLIGPGELKTKLRRLRKKAKLLGTNTAIVPGGDNGISTGWVCVNFTAPGGQTGETERVDEDGKFSGFGSALSGTTVVVQCLTEARRHELDLETLWQGILKRSLREAEEVKGQRRPDDAEIHQLVSTRVQQSGSPSQLQWQSLHEASQQQHQQKRRFSTSMRRMSSSALDQPPETTPETESWEEEVAPTVPAPLSLADLEKSVANLPVMGQPIEDEMSLARLISNILITPLVEEDTAKARIALLDQILLTAHERGMKIMSTRVLAVVINGLVLSPAWGEEIQRAQTNIEMLLAQKRTKLDEQESAMLMEAHASRGDWDRFWDIFNWNTRFAVPRPFSLYEVAFRNLAATGNSTLCLNALRTIWPEFRREEPSVEELQKPLAAARECILVADSISEELITNPPNSKTNRGARHRWFRHHEGRRLLLEQREMEQKVQDLLRFKS
jgi:hypothetical protein